MALRLDMQGTPLPSRVTKPVYYKGLLVAANTKMDEDGTPLFGQVDSDWVHNAFLRRLCQLCGKKIAKTDWCIFPGSHGSWKFQEAPLHVDCAAYSFIKCPNILRKRTTYGVMFCRNYDIIEFEPPHWRDPGVVPNAKGMTKYNTAGLWFGHGDLTYAEGTFRAVGCSTCEWHGLLWMNFDEFLRWARREGDLPQSLQAEEVMSGAPVG